MGKLKKRAKTKSPASRIKKVVNAGDFSEFEDDDIYVKPCKKTHLIMWSRSISNDLGSERGSTHNAFDKIEKAVAKLILLSMCYSNGELIGDAWDEEDVLTLREFDYALIKKLFIESYNINRLPKGQGEELIKIFESLEEVEKTDMDFSEPEPPKKRGKK